MSSKMTSLSFDIWKHCCQCEKVCSPKYPSLEYHRVRDRYQGMMERLSKDPAYYESIRRWKDKRDGM